MKTRIVKLLAAAGCFCFGCCGCFTARLWNGDDYVTPAPDPKLALFRTPQGILVQYDALYEKTGNLHRRAYYLEPNLKRVAAKQKPIFIDPAKAGPQTVIPIFPRPSTNGLPPALRAVCSSDLCSFTLYREGKVLGPFDLPVFKDEPGKVTKVALTPLAVTGDVSIVGGAAAALAGGLWVLLHGGWGTGDDAPSP